MLVIGLPKSTEFNKRIPKQKFYDNISVTPALKRCFVEQIKNIYWRNKIATTTVNLAAGQAVTEIEVFEINLSFPYLDEGVLRQIDKEIPYHILYLLEYEGKYQAWIGYKEATASGNNAFKVNSYYHTDWLAENDLGVSLEGLSLDAVYENFIRQIAGDRLASDSTENLKDSVERSQQIEKLEKRIANLTSKMQREKQFNRKVELNGEIKKLKRELEGLS